MIKRFIAGASCPSCNALDTIQAWTDDAGIQQRECVDCGFSDSQKNQVLANNKLDTRVEYNRADVQTIKIID